MCAHMRARARARARGVRACVASVHTVLVCVPESQCPGGAGLAGPATGMRQLELPTVQRHPELSECTVNLTVRHLVRAKGHLNGPTSPGVAEAAY